MEHTKGNIAPIYKTKPLIIHLIYVDDILIMVKATRENAECIRHIFHNLRILSGLDLNENKLTLFFNKGANHKQFITDILNFNIENLPMIYLGIPMSNTKLKTRDFGFLIDKINKNN